MQEKDPAQVDFKLLEYGAFVLEIITNILLDNFIDIIQVIR